jgi:hypothetical protein
MARNTIAGATLLLCITLLVTAVLGSFRVFSYLSAGLILVTLATAAIERGDSEIDLAPYAGVIGYFGVLFLIGLTGIWLLWRPGISEYTYVLGLPRSTLVYVVFLWLLPSLASIYYAAVVFPKIGNDETVDGIMTDAQEAQRTGEFPLSAARPETDGGVRIDNKGDGDGNADSEGVNDASDRGDARTHAEGGRSR